MINNGAEGITSTFNIELVPARLTPFDWASSTTSVVSNSDSNSAAAPVVNNNINGFQQTPVDGTLTEDDTANIYATVGATGFSIGTSLSGQYNLGTSAPGFGVSTGSSMGLGGLSTSGTSIIPSSHPLYPLTQTGGLVFPFNPVISENLGVRYDTTDLTHTNEAIHAYKNTDNVRLTLSECVWVADTFDQAIYALGVIHFFRSFTLMDFGRRAGTGKPPSPMWFNAYGNYMYSQVPVLIERVDWSFAQDLDYVGVPNPGSDAYNNQELTFSTNGDMTLASQTNGYTWIPVKLTINSISMVVQHSVNYWANEFSLDDFRAGNLIGIN